MKKTIIAFMALFFSFSGVVGAESLSDGRIFMNGTFLNGNILKIDVLSEDLSTPVLGIAFHLNYDSDFLEFLKYEPGEFLERGGDPFYLVSPGKLGEIVFGQTLRRDDRFPIGGGDVASFYFEIIEEANFHFSFDRGVVSTLDVVRQDLSNIKWDDYSIQRPLKKSYASVVDSGAESGNSIQQLFTMIAISVFSLLFAVFVIKKYGDKRHGTYVNFK